MRKLILLSTILVVLTSCFSTKFTLSTFDDCPSPQTKFIVDKNYNDVWDNVIDFFASNNLAIKTIEKESGIIYSSTIKLSTAYWFSESKTYSNPNAHIAVQYRSDYKKDGTGLSATAVWNVRVKKVNDNKTEISINIADPQITIMAYMGKGIVKPVESNLQAKSTGVFEKQLIEYFTK